MSTHGISSGSVTADGRRNGDEMTQGTVAEAALEQTDDGAPQAAVCAPRRSAAPAAAGSYSPGAAADRQPELHDGAGLRGHDPARLARPARDGRLVPGRHVVLAAVRASQVTAGYVSTFVAQYTGAGRPQRVGPAVWQGIHFATLAGLLFLLMVPVAPAPDRDGRAHAGASGAGDAYLRCLCFAALPMLIMAAVNGFFSGRGQTWTVLGIEAAGTAVNVALALVLIFGRVGFPELGIRARAGRPWPGRGCPPCWLCVCCSGRGYRRDFDTLAAGGSSGSCSAGLLKYGGPAGAQVFLDVLVFHVFVQLVGRLGEAATGATTLTVRLNMVAFLPMMGLGQAVSILVGQRLGADRPDLAERSAYTGLKWVFGYMCTVAGDLPALPAGPRGVFEGDRDPESFAAMAAIVPGAAGVRRLSIAWRTRST